MGLAAAYQASLDGHQTELIEAAPEAGGMAAHFDFGGLSIERFYHFVCRADSPTFQLLHDLDIADKMRWRETTMGFYCGGKLHPWGDPVALLTLSEAGLWTKLRYGLFAFVCVRRNRWDALETEPAESWLKRWCGPKGFELFWRPLLEYKFYEYAPSVSAAWIWTRIRRLGRSRKSIFQEELGYLEGGSQTLVNALLEKMEQNGCKLSLNAGAQRITTQDGRVTGVDTARGHLPADFVISTIPVQQISRLVPDLPRATLDRYDAIHNIGICCVILKLRRSISPHFWINIHDDRHQIPGVIEFSNLRPLEDVIVYVPYYMPVTDPKFSWTDAELIDDAFNCLALLNPKLTREDLIDAKVGRLRHAQPICEAGFAAKIPPVQTEIAGLQIADTCFYYPEDRGVSESVRLGREMARAVSRPQ
jgi:protoporphyrinogen oxidase